MTKKQRKILIRILTALLCMIVLAFLPLDGWVRFAAYLVPYLVIGYDILIKAGKGIANRQVFDENFLMSIATVGALVLGLVDSGDYVEAVAVMWFYQVGELFQSYAVGKSRRNIGALMDIRPDCAYVERDGEIVAIDPDEVDVGTVIVVRPGEKIPIDGVIEDGASTLNTAALTGESAPRDVQAGDEVISGCINLTGVLRMRTNKAFGESTVSKILELVENASSRKSRSEHFIAKFARIYTPAVCYGALALAVLPPLLQGWIYGTADWGIWLYRALSFLVASCPCALVISIPLSFFAGIGGASREGVLIKGSNFLETLSQTTRVVFDKTGTLTKGVFEVTDVYSCTPQPLLEYAALAEHASSHPIAQSLRRAYGGEIDHRRVRNLQEISGHGILATVDATAVAVGNAKLMHRVGANPTDCPDAGTVVHVALNGIYAGYIVIADTVKPTAAKAVAALKRAGVRQTVMLTGDTHRTAQQVATAVGIDVVHSDLLPQDKVDAVEQMLSDRTVRGKLAFVGDGINDAPVLSRADIGIAMGAMGSDAAIEAADVVLMDDDPMKIVQAIRISRKCLRIVHQNIWFALAIKLLSLVLVACGVAGMWLAIFADVGVMILAILNATRALFVKRLR